MDALVSDKLSWSPRVVDTYGYCGASMFSEAVRNGDLETVAVPSGVGRLEKPHEDSSQLKPRNALTPTKKLEYSLEMAEAVLLLHAYPGGVIVHDDIQLSQFLLTADGKVKLNDFNRAEVMLWDEKDKEYCRYRNYPGNGDVSHGL